ncbi:MAG: hypothetical protein PHP01_07080 [Phycisphaerae bacterium]|nr:hypothetical protein [Phycisphaerae bacterium]
MKNVLCVTVLVSLVLAGSSSAGFYSSKKQSVPDLTVVKQYVNAYLEIEKIRAGKTPDWTGLKAQYKITLPVVKSIDAKYGTNYGKEIPGAINKCAAGDKAKVNWQVIAKGIQNVTVLAIRQELDLMAAEPNNIKASAERITAYIEGIRPTFARRDKGFFEGKKTLEAAADAAVEQLAKSDKNSLLTASRQLDDVIARTYALSMLYEMQEIERLRDSDLNTCDVKRAEGAMFYRVVQERIEKRSPKTNETLLNMLNGSYGTVNSEEAEKLLAAGLTFKLR